MTTFEGSKIFVASGPTRRVSVMGVVSLIIGVVAVAGAWMHFLGFMASLIAVLGGVLAALALIDSVSNKETGLVVPAVSLAVNVASFAIPLLLASIAADSTPKAPAVAATAVTAPPAVAPSPSVAPDALETAEPVTPAKTTDAVKRISGLVVRGELGANFAAGNLSIGIWYFDTPKIAPKKMSIVSILCEIGNEGVEPIAGPELTPFIFDSTGRKYSAVKTDGTYAAGTLLKSQSWVDQEWAFVLPESLPPEHVEFPLPSGKTISIDLMHGMAENQRAGGASSNPVLSQRFTEFTQGVLHLYSQDPATAPEKPVVARADDSVQELKTKLRNDLDFNTGELEEARAAVQRAERKVKGLISATAHAKDDLDKAQEARAAAEQSATALNGATANNRRDEAQIASHLAKAQGEVERQKRHEADALKYLSEKQKALDAATQAMKESSDRAKALQDTVNKQADAVQKAEQPK